MANVTYAIRIDRKTHEYLTSENGQESREDMKIIMKIFAVVGLLLEKEEFSEFGRNELIREILIRYYRLKDEEEKAVENAHKAVFNEEFLSDKDVKKLIFLKKRVQAVSRQA